MWVFFFDGLVRNTYMYLGPRKSFEIGSLSVDFHSFFVSSIFFLVNFIGVLIVSSGIYCVALFMSFLGADGGEFEVLDFLPPSVGVFFLRCLGYCSQEVALGSWGLLFGDSSGGIHGVRWFLSHWDLNLTSLFKPQNLGS